MGGTPYQQNTYAVLLLLLKSQVLYKVVEIRVTTCEKGHSKLLEAVSTVSSLVSSFLLGALTQARLAYLVPEPV